MPTENANEKPLEKEQKTVPLDTSGPGAEVIVPDEKDESEVETKDKEPTVTYTEPETTEQEPEVKEEETVKEIKQEQKQDDTKLEEYSKGVQGRIAKLTRKMREAERQRDSATEYARALEGQRQDDQRQFNKLDTDYWKRFETNVKTGMDSAQRELAGAIEAGDAKAQVEANKRIATLAFENAKMEQAKEGREDVKLSDGGKLPRQTPQYLPEQPADPQAETWASKNKWFGQNRAMTFTAFEIHKDLVEKEGFDPKSNDYYEEIDKRIRVDFPHKFDRSGTRKTSEPVQTVASATRSVKPGRQTVRLTPSQVAIAKKLGVPLEEYAKQLKLTKEA